MTDISFYSGGRARKIVAETVVTDHDTKWIRILITDGCDEIGRINVFGAAHIESVTSEVKEAA